MIIVDLGTRELINGEKRWALVRKKCLFLIAGKGESQLLGWLFSLVRVSAFFFPFLLRVSSMLISLTLKNQITKSM